MVALTCANGIPIAVIDSDHIDTLGQDRLEYEPDKLLGIQWLQ